MMNNETTARAPLKPSECVDVITQQILGNIKRDGYGQFYTVEPTVEIVPSSSLVSIKALG